MVRTHGANDIFKGEYSMEPMTNHALENAIA